MHKIVGIIGYPLGHSISPAMHNAAFKELGLDYEYIPFEVEPEDLHEAINGLRALHIAGFNVTIPHKEAIVPLLDDVTKLARTIGAVNTVENQEGKLVGYNTDGLGFIESLNEDAEFDPKGKRVVVLGAGGASRGVATMLAEVGANSILLSDIFEDKGNELVEYLNTLTETKCSFAKPDSESLRDEIEYADLLINTTPLGMHPKIGESPLPKKVKLNKKTLVYDLVYNPSETKLLKTAKAAGCKVVSGLGMLVRQGALAFTVFTGEEPPIETMWQAAKTALRQG
ncbi:MAG: shikimate dehydrogenase [Candidatus Margulisbacteria bacterium]|nr:shikimate dehydrogenase [Candidatus Margulisiibacteriota bacterium]